MHLGEGQGICRDSSSNRHAAILSGLIVPGTQRIPEDRWNRHWFA